MQALQYEFDIQNRRSGARNQARATARTEAQAREAIVAYYGDAYSIADTARSVREAHQVAGEINCL